MKKNRNWIAVIGLMLLAGCAGFSRDCNSCMASDFAGADWIVLQYGASGNPINCWRLVKVAVSNERETDGIFWVDPSGHLVHISGWYNRVQVIGGAWDPAAKLLGVDLTKCVGGKYGTDAAIIKPEAP